MRSGQHNNKRGRNRNRRHGGGGGGGHGGGGHGGSPGNRVLDSNGPDVKLRGTAQTIAEKYMQLGRDAQLSGDTVMSESYYQHGEHFYRLWLASQPAGQPIQFSRRPGEDEYEEDASESAEGDDDAAGGDGTTAEGSETSEAAAQDDGDAVPAADGSQQGSPQKNRDFNGHEGGGRRDRFRNRWPRRGDRNSDTPREAPGEQAGRSASSEAEPREADSGNWETPSFLTRPVQAVTEDSESVVESSPADRPRREPRVRRNRDQTSPDPAEPQTNE